MTRTWLDAHVGTETPQVAVRVTPEEKQRLEELRRHHRLTSKAQVIRLALDTLEFLSRPGTRMFEGEEGVKENQEVVEILTARLAGLDRAGTDDTGSPGVAVPGGVELP